MASSMVQDLFERRVPQYVAVYLGGSWALVEFFAFLEDRFLLSPHLTNFVLALLLLLLPSVAVFTYFHGRPGADRWRRFEAVFIPANLVVAVVVLLVGFGDKELGAITTTVSTLDAEGNPVERTVPKAEFRKRIALFPFDAPPDSAWLGEAVVQALHIDLYQDVFLDVRTPGHFMDLLKQRGLADARGVPQALMREITRDLHLGHFVQGTVRPSTGGFEAALTIHDARRGAEQATLAFEAPDLFALADSASRGLRRALDIPAAHLEESSDLPVSEASTESLPAFEQLVKGSSAIAYSMDLAGAERHYERAVEIDPAFAFAHWALYQLRYARGDEQGAGESLQAALQHLYRLPERLQLAVRAEHYGFQQDLDKYLATHEMRTELYPQDIDAHLAVAQLRRLREDLPGVVEALEKVRELDPARIELLNEIGSLYQQMGELAHAEELFRQYVEALPDEPEPYLALGGLHLAAGDHEEARASYEKALLLDPTSAAVLTRLAELDRYTGRWEDAERRAREARETARSPQQRYDAERETRRYRSYRHDFDRAAEHQERVIEAARDFLPPIVVAQLEIAGATAFARAGRVEQARARIEEVATGLPAAMASLVVPLGRAQLWLALGRPDSAAPALERAEQALERTGYEAVERLVVRARGRLHELRGEWDRAAETYEREREIAPSDPAVLARLGRVQRELGDLEHAESLLLQALAVWPSHPEANFDLGLLYLRQDRHENAVRYLEQAAESWAIADPGDPEAADARARLEEARRGLRAVRPSG